MQVQQIDQKNWEKLCVNPNINFIDRNNELSAGELIVLIILTTTIMITMWVFHPIQF